MNRKEQIEFIREKVILANNPECETIDEIVKKEKGLCKYELTSVWFGMDKGIPADSKLEDLYNEREKSKVKFIEENYSIDNKYCYIGGSIIRKKFCFYIGLPLTLERVLVALDKVDCEGGFLYKKEAIYSYYSSFNNSIDLEYLCLWQPNRTLDQQPNDTISKITELLK